MKKLLFVCLMLFAIVFTGCTGQTDAVGTEGVASADVSTEAVEQVEESTDEAMLDTVYPLTIVDGTGREVVIEEAPLRIISIAPSITETIFALGKGDLLIGRTDYCDYPQEALEVESIGSLREPNIEKIAELSPDLIIASTHFKEEVLAKLDELEIKVVVLTAQESFDGVYEVIEKAGQIVNANENASKVIAKMKEDVQYVLDTVKDADKISTYYVVGFGQYGDYTATGDTFLSQIIEMAGGENIAKDAEGWKYSLEMILEHDPEVIIVSELWDTKATFSTTNGYSELSAVKNDKVLEMDANTLDRQGPRLAEGLLTVAKLLHPNLFK